MVSSKVHVIIIGLVIEYVCADLGSVTIQNTIENDLFVWSVGEEPGPMTQLHPADSYRETWRRRDDGGFSIKIATVPNSEDILQFEYTLSSPSICWDISEINMSAQSDFRSVGLSVTSDSSQCPGMMCSPGDFACHEAFQRSSDVWAIHTCDELTNVVLKIGL
jgi:hypothetical protein